MENKKVIKDSKAGIPEIFNGHSLAVNPFKSNFSAAHMFGRAERIVAASYILTKSVPDSDPARERVRSKASELLSVISAWFVEKGGRKEEHIQQLLLIERELASFMRVLAIESYVSTTNLGIFLQALTDLGAYAERHAKDQSVEAEHGGVLSEHDFVPNVEKMAGASVVRTTPSASSGGTAPASSSAIRTHNDTVKAGQKPSEQGTRRQIIIDLLTQKGRLGIRDIAEQIVGVSEKTVQRELVQLVADGRVSKEGKKRWSTYGLVA